MRFRHTNRPGFLLGMTDFFTAGLFFLIYMQCGLQDELDEILGRRTQRYYVAYLLGIPTLFLYTLVWMKADLLPAHVRLERIRPSALRACRGNSAFFRHAEQGGD